jgi:hypothetical protein
VNGKEKWVFSSFLSFSFLFFPLFSFLSSFTPLPSLQMLSLTISLALAITAISCIWFLAKRKSSDDGKKKVKGGGA